MDTSSRIFNPARRHATPQDAELFNQTAWIYQIERAFGAAAWIEECSGRATYLTHEASLRGLAVQYAALVQAVITVARAAVSSGKQVITGSSTGLGHCLTLHLGSHAPIRRASQARRQSVLRDNALIVTEGKSSTYRTTLLPTHTLLAEAAVAAIENTLPGSGSVDWEGLDLFLVSSARRTQVVADHYTQELRSLVVPGYSDIR